jgi:hypothetical protein
MRRDEDCPETTGERDRFPLHENTVSPKRWRRDSETSPPFPNELFGDGFACERDGREVAIIGWPDGRKAKAGNASPTFTWVLAGELLKHCLDLGEGGEVRANR